MLWPCERHNWHHFRTGYWFYNYACLAILPFAGSKRLYGSSSLRARLNISVILYIYIYFCHTKKNSYNFFFMLKWRKEIKILISYYYIFFCYQNYYIIFIVLTYLLLIILLFIKVYPKFSHLLVNFNDFKKNLNRYYSWV